MEFFKSVLIKSEVLNHVKNSKFIGIVFPCTSIAEFEEELTKIKKTHQGANHHCYAYRIKENVLLERYQDDKEPSGTAGLPILDVLKGNDLYQCGLVVVRYFGGTKLGTGGLSRAYSDAARDAVEQASIASMEETCYLLVEVDYHFSGKLEYYINTKEIPLLNTNYESLVKYLIARPSHCYHECVAEINELTNGQAIVNLEKKVVGYFNKNQFIEI